MRLELPNNCACSKVSVSPKNWQNVTHLEDTWYIHYRFFSPDHPEGKLIKVKGGLNTIRTIRERRSQAKILLQAEIENLQNGYNPILKTRSDAVEESLLTDALEFALTKINVSSETRRDMSNTLTKFNEAAREVCNIEVQRVSRKHIRLILDHLGKSPSFTNNTFNAYRKYLQMLFSELVELEMIPANPVKDIKRRKVERKQKAVLTLEERAAVDAYLKTNYPAFYRFVHIFFHSGARVRELLRVKCGQVDLNRQRFKVVIRKGKEYRETWKVIKDVALPYWTEIDLSEKDNYLFSRNLNPGAAPIRPDQINKRWKRIIMDKDWELYGKKDHKITATFYSLKHLHSDETAALLSIEDAAKINSHTGTDVTLLYAQGEKERQLDRIKKLKNKF